MFFSFSHNYLHVGVLAASSRIPAMLVHETEPQAFASYTQRWVLQSARQWMSNVACWRLDVDVYVWAVWFCDLSVTTIVNVT